MLCSMLSVVYGGVTYTSMRYAPALLESGVWFGCELVAEAGLCYQVRLSAA